jgi:outer membrane protein assembly factor BamA
MIRIVLAFGLLFTSQLWGQENYELSFNRQKDSKLERYEKKTFESKDNVLHILNKIRNKDIKSGYVLASIDSILWNNNTANVTYHRGDYFEKLQIDYKQEDAYLIKQVPRINERLLTRLPFNGKSVGELLNGLTHYLNNNGYPFSKVFLKVKYIEPTASVLELHIEKGPLVKIKSIELKGEPKVNKKYISNFISIQKGDLFNNELMKR